MGGFWNKALMSIHSDQSVPLMWTLQPLSYDCNYVELVKLDRFLKCPNPTCRISNTKYTIYSKSFHCPSLTWTMLWCCDVNCLGCSGVSTCGGIETRVARPLQLGKTVRLRSRNVQGRANMECEQGSSFACEWREKVKRNYQKMMNEATSC